MRTISVIAHCLLLLSLVSSCIRESPCEQLAREDNVELLPQWEEVNRPPSLFVRCYPMSGGAVIQNFISSSGGYVYLPQDSYELLLYSNNSPYVNFRNMETFGAAEAYVDEGMQPDELYCGNVEIKKIDGRMQIKVPMVNMVYEYPFTYSGVTGLQYVNGIFVSIDGINLAVNMKTGLLTSVTSVVNCPYSLTNDGFTGVLHCFGHGGTSTTHSLSVRFSYGGRTLVKVYDVTEMLNEQGRIDIHDNIVFEPVGQGDIDTGVGDWEDDMVDIPIN